jgi:hypothetical protein
VLFYGAKKDGAGEAGKAKRRRKREVDPFGAGFEGLVPNLRRRYEEGSWVEQERPRAVSRAPAPARPARARA